MTDNRLRTPPAERFDAAAHLFDLRAVAEELRAEQSETYDGHRQKALYKNGDATVALFLFAPGGALPPHAADGTVTIQPIEGEFEVEHSGRTERLGPASLLVFAPGEQHGVRCVAGGIMLLTVSLHDRNRD